MTVSAHACLGEVLAAHAGRENVAAGEIVTAKVDLTEVNDLYLQVIKSFYEMGGQRVKNPAGVVFVLDHYAPAPTFSRRPTRRPCASSSGPRG